MKKHIFAVAALLLAGVSAKAAAPLAADSEKLDGESVEAAIALLIKSGAATVTDDGQLKVDANLMQQLRQQGLINSSPIEMGSQCIDGGK